VYNINKQRNGYYIGKIESMNEKDGITTMKVSPILSKRKFAYEIKANHQIEYKTEHINITGLREQRSKNFKEVKLGELGEIIKNLKVGDNIIFKIKSGVYDKNEYNLKAGELAVDLTLE
jgi:ribosomal protein S6